MLLLRIYDKINLSYLFDLDFSAISRHSQVQDLDRDGIAFIGGNAAAPKLLVKQEGLPSLGEVKLTHGDDPSADHEQFDSDKNDFEAQ